MRFSCTLSALVLRNRTSLKGVVRTSGWLDGGAGRGRRFNDDCDDDDDDDCDEVRWLAITTKGPDETMVRRGYI